MMRRALVLAFAVVVSLVGGPAGAQIEGALPLPVDTPLTLPAAGGGAVTTFYFSGVPGEGSTIETNVGGAVEFDIYDAEGNRLVDRNSLATGAGQTFHFIPPYAETYLLVMTRQGPPVSVTLRSSRVAPTLQQALMATGVGYEFTSEHGTSWTCWSEPGVEVAQFGTLRDGTSFTHRLRLRSDRNTQDMTSTVGTTRFASSVRNWIEGDTRVTEVTQGGKTSIVKSPIDTSDLRWPVGYARKWRGYNCPP